MSIKKRKIKNRFFQQVKLFFLTFFGILVLFSVVYLVFILVFPKKELFINPLAKSTNSASFNQINDTLQKADITFTSVVKNQDSSYTVNLKDGGKVILTENKNVQNQVSSLQLILSRLTIEGKRFKSLDFRYDKPVVSF